MMIEKLVLFGVGYVLGSKAGRERYDDLKHAFLELTRREEVATALHVARGVLESRLAGVPERWAA